MINKILLIAFALICKSALSTELPASIEVTSENAKSLGIRISEEDSGASTVKLFHLQFPQKYSGCVAGRVASTLLSTEGEEVSSSSMDYQVGGSSPSILAHFQPSMFDMAIVIQYCCHGAKTPRCTSALVINSIRELGAWK